MRVLDNLEPQTHRHGRPAWVQADENFIEGDLCDNPYLCAPRSTESTSFFARQQPMADTMPEIAKYVAVNFRPVEAPDAGDDSRRKTTDKKGDRRFLAGCLQRRCRPVSRARLGFRRCGQSSNSAGAIGCSLPVLLAVTISMPTPENAPIGGETVYGLTKVDQEARRLWGQTKRHPCRRATLLCYGLRQSITNPYTGVIAIFCTRLLNDLPPVLN